MSVEALSLLRRDLISTLSLDRAKGFLLRYGRACGYNDGETIERMYNWESKKELILAGPALHTLEGIVTVEPDVLEFDDNKLYMSGFWRYSFEAEEHIQHFGYSEEAVCWILVGYVKGYLEKTYGKEIVIYEKSCTGKGDDYCYFVAQTAEHVEPEHREILHYYQEESLGTELDKMYSQVSTMNKSIIRSNQVQKQLTNLLLEGNTLSCLIDYLSTVLGRSVVIEKSPLNKPLVASFLNAASEKIYQQQLTMSPTDRQIDSFEISANKLSFGRLIIIGSKPITQEEIMIVENSISVLSIHLHTQKTMALSLQKEQSEFFDSLVNSTVDTQSLIQKASQLFTFDIEKSSRIIVIKNVLKENTEGIGILIKDLYPTVDLFIKNSCLVMVLGPFLEKEHPIEKLVEEVRKLIEHNFPQAKFFIGAGRNSNSIDELGKSYLDAFRICDFLDLTYPQKNNAAIFEKINPTIMLFLKTMEPEELFAFCNKILGRLIEFDEKNDANLIQTLRCYLDNNCKVNKTANDLNLSIPGLRYRLEKITSLCDADFKTGSGAFQCQIAIQFYYAVKVINIHRS